VSTGLYDASLDDIAAVMSGQPSYRVKQVWQALYEQLRAPADMTNLPAALRDELGTALPESLVWKTESTDATGDTVKFLWSLRDGGHPIETVLMLYPDRATVCVSTQAGCAMACGFCATGQAGFNRHLTAGEIVEQVVKTARRAREIGRRVSNIVFMGMGARSASPSPSTAHPTKSAAASCR